MLVALRESFSRVYRRRPRCVIGFRNLDRPGIVNVPEERSTAARGERVVVDGKRLTVITGSDCSQAHITRKSPLVTVVGALLTMR